MSHWLDPLPDLLAWLEAISLGMARCGWMLEEESTFVTFNIEDARKPVIFNRSRDPVSLTIVPDYDAPTLTCELSRRELVQCFYRAFCEFAASTRYLPNEWELRTFGEVIRQSTGVDPINWVDALLTAPLTRRELQKRFWLIHRGTIGPGWPDGEMIGTAAEYAEMTVGAPLAPGMSPRYWSHAEWEALPDNAARRAYLSGCLDDSEDSAWRGLPWRQMRSVWLEDWLEQDNARASHTWIRWLGTKKHGTVENQQAAKTRARHAV
jgi:hypothetical protein